MGMRGTLSYERVLIQFEEWLRSDTTSRDVWMVSPRDYSRDEVSWDLESIQPYGSFDIFSELGRSPQVWRTRTIERDTRLEVQSEVWKPARAYPVQSVWLKTKNCAEIPPRQTSRRRGANGFVALRKRAEGSKPTHEIYSWFDSTLQSAELAENPS